MNLLDKQFVQLAQDTAFGKLQLTEFSAKDGSDAIRKAFVEKFGEKMDYYSYEKNKLELFAFISEVINPIINDRTQEVYGKFADFRNIKLGDKNEFIVTNRTLFPVNTISLGNGHVNRHRLESDKFSIELSAIAVGTYEELVLFLAGRTDWALFIKTVADSITHEIFARIATALAASVEGRTGVYKATVASSSGAEAIREKALEVADHVEADNGAAMFVGTKAALRKLKPEYFSDAQAGERNNTGVFAMVEGFDLIELPQFHKAFTDEFALNDKQILVLPAASNDIVKVVIGDTFVREANGTENNRQDMQMQHDVIQIVGVSVVTAAKFGVIELS